MFHVYITYDDENLEKHGLSRDDADELLETDIKIEEPMPNSERGNARVMLIGFNSIGQLLEIGIEVFSINRIHVFHGKKANKRHRALFEQGFE